MEYQGLIKLIQLPASVEMPTALAFDDIEIHALGREHLADDVAGINASIELIRRTRGRQVAHRSGDRGVQLRGPGMARVRVP